MDPRIKRALWVSAAIGAVVLLLLVLVQWLTENKIEAIRNIILALGGIGALFGVWVASIRGSDFAKQVDTQTRQTRSETLSRCIEQIGHEKSSGVRTAGIIGLETLARDNRKDTEFLQHLCDILQGFINERAPSRWHSPILPELRQTRELPSSHNLQALIQAANLDDGHVAKLKEWDAHWQEHKAEAAEAIHTFARIVAIKPSTLRRLDLSHRYLPEIYPSEREGGKSSLREASLSNSFLPYASLNDADLSGAFLLNADLRGVHLLKTILREAELSSANLRNTIFCEAKLEEANFSNAKLAGATYYENESDYFKITGNGPSSPRKKVTSDWLKAQGAENWEKAIYSDDPKV